MPPATPIDWTTASLGERILHACKLRGWSLNELGRRAGLASGVISRLARRAKSTAGSPEALRKVADAARISSDWLIYGRGPIEIEARRVTLLREHPAWPRALQEARRRVAAIPDDFWELAGECSVRAVRVDWELVAGVARELYSAHLRDLQDLPDDAAASSHATGEVPRVPRAANGTPIDPGPVPPRARSGS